MLNIYEFNPADTITVEVTAEDIVSGRRNDCSYCPIARALKRLFPEVDMISVSTHQLALYNAVADDAYYSCPPEAKTFINRFDAEARVEPFIFTAVRI